VVLTLISALTVVLRVLLVSVDVMQLLRSATAASTTAAAGVAAAHRIGERKSPSNLSPQQRCQVYKSCVFEIWKMQNALGT